MGARLCDLTDDDLDIATLLAMGMTRAEVAARRNWTEPTVQGVIVRIRKFTDSLNITHAIAILVQAGMVRIDDPEREVPYLPADAGPAASAVHKTLLLRGRAMPWPEFRSTLDLFQALSFKGL